MAAIFQAKVYYNRFSAILRGVCDENLFTFSNRKYHSVFPMTLLHDNFLTLMDEDTMGWV